MKQKTMRNESAFTRVELIVVIAVGVLVVSMLVPAMGKWRNARNRATCLNNLKQIGIAYRIWPQYMDVPPARETVLNGGWADLLTNANQGPNCWTNYALMADVLGQSPKLLVCPFDERKPARDFATDFKDNTHLSYFVGVSAADIYPQTIQGGDRNLGLGTKPDPDYGLSPKDGKGNDVAIPIAGPVSWSLKMHSAGNATGAGNIILGDGSGQQTTTSDLNQTWLRNSDPTTTWPAGHLPVSPSIRFVFP
jgi:hypothetical protein